MSVWIQHVEIGKKTSKITELHKNCIEMFSKMATFSIELRIQKGLQLPKKSQAPVILGDEWGQRTKIFTHTYKELLY